MITFLKTEKNLEYSINFALLFISFCIFSIVKLKEKILLKIKEFNFDQKNTKKIRLYKEFIEKIYPEHVIIKIKGFFKIFRLLMVCSNKK